MGTPFRVRASTLLLAAFTSTLLGADTTLHSYRSVNSADSRVDDRAFVVMDNVLVEDTAPTTRRSDDKYLRGSRAGLR